MNGDAEGGPGGAKGSGAETHWSFSQLKRDPSLITPDLRSPVFHPEGLMSVLYEGDPPTVPVCYAEWMEAPQPLENIPGTLLWGGDFPAPPIPDDVCSMVRILAQDAIEWIDGTPLPSYRHMVPLRGPALPASLESEGPPSFLVEDFGLPAPGRAGETWRTRIYLPRDCRAGAACTALFIFDGQLVANEFPVIPDTLRRRGRIPPVIQVVMDYAEGRRQSEYLAGRPLNAAARRWVWEVVVPYVDGRYRPSGRWVVGGSNGASFALQVCLGRPQLFSGGVFWSPYHREGLDKVLALADGWPGGGRFFISIGGFGLGEQNNQPAARRVAARLAAQAAEVKLAIYPGHGHDDHAARLVTGDGVGWLLSGRP